MLYIDMTSDLLVMLALFAAKSRHAGPLLGIFGNAQFVQSGFALANGEGVLVALASLAGLKPVINAHACMSEGAQTHRPGQQYNNANTLLFSRVNEISMEGGPQSVIQAIAWASMEAAERAYIQTVSLVITCCMVAHTVASVDRGADATPEFQLVEVEDQC